jgi:hypothetical protein
VSRLLVLILLVGCNGGQYRLPEGARCPETHYQRTVAVPRTQCTDWKTGKITIMMKGYCNIDVYKYCVPNVIQDGQDDTYRAETLECILQENCDE